MQNNRPEQIAVWILVALGIVGLLAFSLQDLMPTYVPWTVAKEQVASGKVIAAEIDDDILRLKIKGENGREETIDTVIVPQDKNIISLLESNKVEIQAQTTSGCQKGMSWMTILLVLALILYYFIRGPQSQAAMNNSFSRSKATLATESESNVRFSDVAGIDEAIEELEELVDFLKTPQKFTALGGKIPKGVMLFGPPGTGKTLLAKAVAGEAKVPFFHCSGSDFVEIYVGVGAARVRDLFQQAKKAAPCIIFIDELDAIGKSRTGQGMNGNDEREQTLNQLLVAMDGFDSQKGVIIMAATNRPDALDPALLRAGRFDRQVVVSKPDLRGREEILQVHARIVSLDPNIVLKDVARLTPGFSGADLANTLNEAALLAARKNKSQVEIDDIEEAIERTIAGLQKKSRRISEQEKRIVAIHECGHAICATACPKADPVTKISIIPRGAAALGYTMQIPEEDRQLYSQQSLWHRIVVLFGGRVAEEVLLNEITTGASDDIQRASEIARQMVRRYGMSKKIGPISYEIERNQFGFGNTEKNVISVETSSLIDLEIQTILQVAYQVATNIIQHNQSILLTMADRLIEEESLGNDALQAYLQEVPPLQSEHDHFSTTFQPHLKQPISTVKRKNQSPT